MILLKLFLVFFRIGLFAIGGAYSFVPLLQKDIVENYNWVSREEFLDILGIVKLFPGAISIKFATYTGNKLAGIPGIIVANVANMLAPVVLILIATVLFNKHKDVVQVKSAFSMIQIVIFAMIIAVAFKSIEITTLINLRNFIVILASFYLFMFTKIHPALIIFFAGIIGALGI